MKNKAFKTKLLTALLTLCMVLSLVPMTAATAFAANTTTVTNETELTAALNNADCTEIKLGSNIETTGNLYVERTVTLDLNRHTLSCSSENTCIIWVRKNGNLAIKDSGTDGKIDGQEKNCGIFIKGGVLTLESGSIVNCYEKIIDEYSGDGAAVDLETNGQFIMNGGAIEDCRAGDDGGAIDIGSGCTFIMNGGAIKNCKATKNGGAVIVKDKAKFEMNDGLIEGCSVTTTDGTGGGVYIANVGRFVMSGGTIKDCTRYFSDYYGYIGNGVAGETFSKAEIVLKGGTFDNCGTFGCTIDTHTVTFDSDGGSDVDQQEICNTSAIKPSDPKKDGYDFAGWYLGDTQYTFDTKITTDITLKAHWTPTSASTAITAATIQDVNFNYQPGDAPRATAKKAGTNQDKYDILFECWEKQEKDANDTINTVGYWYSDESCYSDGDVRFSTFEKGGRYGYSVKLQAKDGYTFDSNLTNTENVTLNGASLPFGSWVMVMDDGKTCLIQYGTELRPGQAVEKIDFNARINFNAGDKPSFMTSAVNPFIDLDHERWDANDGSGYGITSSDYWNERYNGKLITEFEAGKSYTYGVYFKISDLGMEEGYRFDKNTKLYINGEEITLTPDQINVDDNGETIWFSNVLTMTPTTVKVIDVVEINGVTVSFKDGDKPVFTGKSPEGVKYAYNCEWWELDSKTGAISADFFSGAYENKITAFEAGKTYHYGVYVKAVGYVESENTTYLFGPNTKLKINGEFVNYTRYEGDESDGSDGTMWVLTDLTMTPEAGGTTPAEKYTVTYTDGVDNEEIFKDQTYTVESGKATPAFNGTPARKGYTFAGWKPAVAATVTSNATYEATWKSDSATTTPSDNKPSTGETTSPKTGDTSNIVLWAALLFVSCGTLAGTLVIDKKKKTMK